jgi:hypothetical protein
MMTTASPPECAKPAEIAAWWPKFRDKRTSVKHASVACRSRMIRAESSELASSTKMTRQLTSSSREQEAVSRCTSFNANPKAFHIAAPAMPIRGSETTLRRAKTHARALRRRVGKRP